MTDVDASTLEAREHLTFRLGKALFALEASRVTKVLKRAPITNIPRMPPYLPGVINVRGSIIPVIDLAMALGIDVSQDKQPLWFVISEAALADEQFQIGILTDAVQDVVRLETAAVEPPPDIGINIALDFIGGVAKDQNGYLIMIDIGKIINAIHRSISQKKTGA